MPWWSSPLLRDLVVLGISTVAQRRRRPEPEPPPQPRPLPPSPPPPPPAEERARKLAVLRHNERTRLTAAWFNALSAVLIAAGIFAPVAALVLGAQASPAGQLTVIAVSLVCFAIGVGLHVAGRGFLGRLEE